MFLKQDKTELPLYIIAASPAQKRVLSGTGRKHFLRLKGYMQSLVRNAYHALRSCAFLRSPTKEFKAIDVLMITYIYESYTVGEDPFFGDLITRLKKSKSNLSYLIMPYVHGRFGRALAMCKNHKNVELLFSGLGFSEIVKSFYITLSRFSSDKLGCFRFVIDGIDLGDLLIESLHNDITNGTYFYNILLHESFKKKIRKRLIKEIIYPYENKSLEKMILLAVRSDSPQTACVGYQHSSVTQRHTTLLFEKNESISTPLPDKIITLGEVTRNFLQENGNYPHGVLQRGSALRQSFPLSIKPFPKSSDTHIRILLPLSSSKMELLESIVFCKKVRDLYPNIKFGVRPHPEFPLALLPTEDIAWLDENGVDLSGTSLKDNIFWADICVYVSSTVAVEAMMYGLPVINLRLNDVIDPDPVLNNPFWHWQVCTPDALVELVKQWEIMSDSDIEKGMKTAREYAKEYFFQPTDKNVQQFLMGWESE